MEQIIKVRGLCVDGDMVTLFFGSFSKACRFCNNPKFLIGTWKNWTSAKNFAQKLARTATKETFYIFLKNITLYLVYIMYYFVNDFVNFLNVKKECETIECRSDCLRDGLLCFDGKNLG